MEEHFRDYSCAIKARFSSPYQDNWEWKQFGRGYTQLLALLQLDAKLVQEIWPQESGGEAAYMRLSLEAQGEAVDTICAEAVKAHC